MLRVDHVDAIHVHFMQPESILSAALRAGIEKATGEQLAGTVRTSVTRHSPPALGALWPGEGGRYAGTMPAIAGRPGYHLIVAEQHAEALKWGPYDNDVEGAKDHYDGVANTQALVASGKEYPAAAWARGVEVDEICDFYLPAHNELMLMRICAPQLIANEDWYWTSTQYSPSNAWVQDFGRGYSCIGHKCGEHRAMAMRRLSF